MIKLLKLLCFLIAWSVSALSIYFIFMTHVSPLLLAYSIMAFILSMLYLIFNHLK